MQPQLSWNRPWRLLTRTLSVKTVLLPRMSTWAAVRTQRSAMTIPPPLSPLMFISTCHGMLSGSATLPPMILWWPERGFRDRPQTKQNADMDDSLKNLDPAWTNSRSAEVIPGRHVGATIRVSMDLQLLSASQVKPTVEQEGTTRRFKSGL